MAIDVTRASSEELASMSGHHDQRVVNGEAVQIGRWIGSIENKLQDLRRACKVLSLFSRLVLRKCR